MVVESILAQAKGKCPEYTDACQAIDFNSLLQYQNHIHSLYEFKSEDNAVMYSWWCYSKRSLATETDIDRQVIVEARDIMDMIKERKKLDDDG
jgi:hypothetical protein